LVLIFASQPLIYLVHSLIPTGPAAATATVERKEDDAVAQTLDEAWAREHATALAWEEEKTIAHHLQQQLAAAQGIAIPQDDDRSINAFSNLNAPLTAHLHAQAIGLQNVRLVVTIILEHSSLDYKR
jgi:hypothetical protein